MVVMMEWKGPRIGDEELIYTARFCDGVKCDVPRNLDGRWKREGGDRVVAMASNFIQPRGRSGHCYC